MKETPIKVVKRSRYFKPYPQDKVWRAETEGFCAEVACLGGMDTIQFAIRVEGKNGVLFSLRPENALAVAHAITLATYRKIGGI